MTSEAPRVGVYGGTFDPIHVAHLRAAEEVAEALGLAQVVFVPSGQPPHKDVRRLASGEPDPIAPAALRLAWVRDAIAGNARFTVSPVVVDRDCRSYRVLPLDDPRDALAPARLVFVLGRDAFQEMGSWREPRRLLTLADFAVTTRPPVEPRTDRLDAWLPACARDDFDVAGDGMSAVHRAAATELRLVPITAIDVAATDVRARIRAGRSVRYLVPDAARDAIERSGAYAPDGCRTTGAKSASTRPGRDDA